MRTFTKIRDLDIKILLEISYKDLLSKCGINKYVNSLCKDNNLWWNKIAIDFPLRGKFIWYTEYRNLYNDNPKKLYEIINEKSKIVNLKSNDYPELAKRIFEEDQLGELSEDDLDFISNQIILKLTELPLLRGDVIHLDWLGNYRNDGKLMWDGEKAVSLYYELDDYGTVPKCFSFPEFPVDHFYSSIEHNKLIWIAPNSLEEIIRNFDEKTQKSFVRDLYQTYPVIAGAIDEEENLIILTSEQFAKYARTFPFFDEEYPSPNYTADVPDGTLLVGRMFGDFNRISQAPQPVIVQEGRVI